jgi:hypothetical protein
MVQGPPGSGKSSMAWIWACQQIETNSVFWIHLGREATHCTNNGGQWQKETLPLEALKSVISNCISNILVIDGLANNVQLHEELLSIALNRLSNKFIQKLVIVTALQFNMKMEELKIYQIKPFKMPSWTEYESAYAVEEFRNSIDATILKQDCERED